MIRQIVLSALLLAACETTEVAVSSRQLAIGETVELKHIALRLTDGVVKFPVAGELKENGWVEFVNPTIDVSANCVAGIRPLNGDPGAGLVCDQNGGPAVMVSEAVVRQIAIEGGFVWQYVLAPHVELQRVRDQAYTLIIGDVARPQ